MPIGSDAAVLSDVFVEPGIRSDYITAQQFTSILPMLPCAGTKMRYNRDGLGAPPSPAGVVLGDGTGFSDQTVVEPASADFVMTTFGTKIEASRWANGMVIEPATALAQERPRVYEALTDALARAAVDSVANAFSPLANMLTAAPNQVIDVYPTDEDPQPDLTESMLIAPFLKVTAGRGRPDAIMMSSLVLDLLVTSIIAQGRTPDFRPVLLPDGTEISTLFVFGVPVIRNDWIPNNTPTDFPPAVTSRIYFMAMGPGLLHGITKPEFMTQLVQQVDGVTSNSVISEYYALIGGIALGTYSALSILEGFKVSE